MNPGTPFDRLAGRFARNIYDTPKGQLRLQFLKEDLAPRLKDAPLRVLDAGGGLGQMSRWLAERGHQVVLCDDSATMLAQAAEANAAAGLASCIELVQASVADFASGRPAPFDLILCHAVLEWVAEPEALLAQLAALLHPDGQLSLMFYNRHALVLRNALRGNLRRVMQGPCLGDTTGLTPSHPQDPETVYGWLKELGLEPGFKAGMRCFYDYLPRQVQQSYDLEDIVALERAYRQQQPYLHMARYIHLIAAFEQGSRVHGKMPAQDA